MDGQALYSVTTINDLNNYDIIFVFRKKCGWDKRVTLRTMSGRGVRLLITVYIFTVRSSTFCTLEEIFPFIIFATVIYALRLQRVRSIILDMKSRHSSRHET